MSGLVKYDAAINAIAEAMAVDELLSIRDTADAMRAAARVANNKQAEVDMAEIRFRAERRVGEMMAAQQLNRGAAAGGSKSSPRGSYTDPRDKAATLNEVGIDKHLADRARKLAAIPKSEFDAIVGDWRERVEGENERVTVNLLKAGEKRATRDEKEAALAEKIRAGVDALTQGRFGVILADPPWRFEPYSRDTGMDRAADNHYPTMELADIEALAVPAADDCVLFLWATAPMIREALGVMAAWGFAYKSQIVWVKDRIGTGYWARNKHELLLIGVRGDIPAPEPGTQPDSAIVAALGRHSEKPEIFHTIIEGLFPNLPKIEMFSRQARDGWHGWGAESAEFDPETGEIVEDEITIQPDPGPAAPAKVEAAQTETRDPPTTPPAGSDAVEIPATIQPETATQSTAARTDVHGMRSVICSEGPAETPSQGDGASRAVEAAGTQAPPVDTHSNVTPIRKVWKLSDPAHRDCLNPGTCGGMSNIKLCQPCRETAARAGVA